MIKKELNIQCCDLRHNEAQSVLSGKEVEKNLSAISLQSSVLEHPWEHRHTVL